MPHPCVSAYGSFVKPFGGYHVIQFKTQLGAGKPLPTQALHLKVQASRRLKVPLR